MGICRLAQWEYTVDYGLEGPLVYQLDDTAQVPSRLGRMLGFAQTPTDHYLLAAPLRQGIVHHRAHSAAAPDRNQTPTIGKGLLTPGKHLATHHVQSDLHSFAVGYPLHLREEVVAGVVDGCVGPQLLGPGDLGIGASGGDYSGASNVLGDRHARHTHPASRRLNQGRLTGR